jgi:hypothetical protein
MGHGDGFDKVEDAHEEDSDVSRVGEVEEKNNRECRLG